MKKKKELKGGHVKLREMLYGKKYRLLSHNSYTIEGNSDVSGPLVHTFNPCIVEAETETERQEDLYEFDASHNYRVKLYQNRLKGPK